MLCSEFLDKESKRIWTPFTKHHGESVRRIEKFMEFAGDIPLADITVDMVHDFFDDLAEDGLSNATVSRYRAALSKFLSHAVRTKKIIEKPDFVWSGDKANRSRLRTFSDEEVAKLYAYLDRSEAPWMSDMVRLSLTTGMRHGEIRKLISGEARVNEDWIYLPITKNGDERYVPVTGKTLEAAKKLSRCRTYSEKMFYKIWTKARDAIARGDKDFVFHACRHTCATTLANDLELNTVLIAKMLGHRSPLTTAKYIHGKSDHLMSVARKMAGDG